MVFLSLTHTHTHITMHGSENVKCASSQQCTLVQALRFCTAHRGSRGIALPFYGNGTRRGWGVSVTPRPLFTPGKEPVPIVQKAEWDPGPVWTGAENLAPNRIRSPDRPAHSQSLYKLSCPLTLLPPRSNGKSKAVATNNKSEGLMHLVGLIYLNVGWCMDL
jgi:hypothetical protein